MKHLIIILFISLFGVAGFSQHAYQPMVVEGATWVDEFQPSTNSAVYLLYKIEGDTLVDGLKYKKVYRYQASKIRNSKVIIQGDKLWLHSVFREDSANRVVYARNIFFHWNNCEPDTDYVLYDFSLDKGDLFHDCAMPDLFEGDSIIRVDYQAATGVLFNQIETGELADSLQVFLGKGGKFTFKGQRNYIEGIGLETGLFANVEDRTTQLDGYDLYCYCRDSSCQNVIKLTTSVDGVREVTNIVTISPNPASHHINLKLNPFIQIENISLLSIEGKATKSWNALVVTDGKAELDIRSIQPGIYILRLATRDHRIFHKKVIIK